MRRDGHELGVEFGNPIALEQDGWTRNTAAHRRRGQRGRHPRPGSATQAFAKSVTLAKTGKKLFVPEGKAADAAGRRARAALARWSGSAWVPLPARRGTGAQPSAHALVDSTAGKIAMNDEGLLQNLADVDRVAPFQPWAKAVYEYRQRTLC